MLEHGGCIRQATQRYGIPVEDWVDLSTGINPHGWPVPEVCAERWRRLPETEDGLEAAARAYYCAPSLLPVAGSQAAIQALPRLRARSRVGVLTPGYGEHRHAWLRSGHEVLELSVQEIRARLSGLDVVVVANPNNPTGERLSPRELLAWHFELATRGGWLVVDEAFIDATPGQSLAAESRLPGLVVLRSLGKFFGLAGARVGFVLAEPKLLEALDEVLGPWALANASRYVATHALADQAWQQETRCRLRIESARLDALLARSGLKPTGGTALFQWVPTTQAQAIHEHLARRGILTRFFREPIAGLRFGLPAAEHQWKRLAGALAELQNAAKSLEQVSE